MSKSDAVLNACQGGWPLDARCGNDDAIVVDEHVPMPSATTLQDTKEDSEVDALISDLGPMLGGITSRNAAGCSDSRGV
ncbi:hypothetical protein V6N13_080913 [Hibiscus sabdariffa]|uniref:Uncharacterized protein n=2 Tax=Hibiscus sabdariffa TaxID=183260 RepID=A0ABR2NGH4_9ROSI